MQNWQDTILHIYQILQAAVGATKLWKIIRRIARRDYEVEDIKENMQTGELHFGDKITALGTFSEFLPFIDPKFILKDEARLLPRALPRTARIGAIEDVYCGALFPLNQDNAFGSKVMPIFYGIDSRMLEHITGEMLELECKIIQVPTAYKEVINKNEYFTFEKEEGLAVPFGLEILSAKPYGIVDSFKINAWLIGNINPSPYYNITTESCQNCGYFFSYMAIKPFRFPPRHGCFKFNESGLTITKELKQQSQEFLKLEKEATPYVVFPEPFRLFELFYPIVDIFNDDEKENSKSILLGAIHQNLAELFRFPGAFPSGLEIPRNLRIHVDFQYDQQNKITQQIFDATRVPEWECPNWEPKPEKVGKSRQRKKPTIGK